MSHQKHAFLRVLSGDLKHIPRPALITILSISVYTFGWGFADPFFAIYLDGFSDSYAKIGFFLTMQTAISIIVLFPLGDLLDRVKHLTLINTAKIGYILVASSYLVAGMLGSEGLLMATLLFHGLCLPFVWTSTSATLIDFSSENNASLISGLFTTAQQLTFTIALAVALLFIDTLPIYLIFVPVILFTILSMFLGQKEDSAHTEPVLRALKDVVVRDKLVVRFFREVKKFNIEMWIMYAVLFFVHVVKLVTRSFLPLLMVDNGYSLSTVGIFVLVTNIPFFFSVFTSEVADHGGRIRTLLLGMGVVIASFASLLFLSDSLIELLIAGFFLMLGFAIMTPAVLSIISVMTPKSVSGASSAMIDLSTSMTFVLCAPLVGWIVDRFDWSGLFFVCAVFFGALFVLMAIVQVFFRKKNEEYTLHHRKGHAPYVL